MSASHELHPDPAFPITLRAIAREDGQWIVQELMRNWESTRISSLGVWYDADRLPGLVAWRGSERIGLATHTPPTRERGCEVITLSAAHEGAGVGTALLSACADLARTAGCARIHLTTTNDNLRAIGFYQKRGWSMVAIHRGAMDRARAHNPVIPLIGLHGIPLHDEIEFELALGGGPIRP